MHLLCISVEIHSISGGGVVFQIDQHSFSYLESSFLSILNTDKSAPLWQIVTNLSFIYVVRGTQNIKHVLWSLSLVLFGLLKKSLSPTKYDNFNWLATDMSAATVHLEPGGATWF